MAETAVCALIRDVKPHHKYLIRKSFATIEAHGSIATLIFYRRLFEIDPELRPLFNDDIEIQAKKLTVIPGFLIGLLENGGALEAELEAMGARHAGYGVQESHYATAGAALLTMLAKVLGPDFTVETEEAWTTLYQAVEMLMKRGAVAAAAPC